MIIDEYGIRGLNSKDSINKGLSGISPILFSPLNRAKNVLRRKHAQIKDFSAKHGAATLKATINKYGRIDVVVNNAGYTHLATIEEMSDADAREEFNINVFGLLNVIRNVLPIMRDQHCSHIFNVGSLGSYNVGPLSGIYCASLTFT
ncbi:MAG: SDR family NAD(P)-dependent oxidoreductase [Bacillota bacterium]|nr:SDR family NAD(P)-dependent oxidoreductase [Bacillota bacterium]